MRLIATKFNYDFYIGINKKGQPYYNVIPTGQPKPKGGYMSAEYICKIKNVPNLFESM